MKLIANKPCSFGGRKFFIGEEIPGELVADAKWQEKLGTLTVSVEAQPLPSTIEERDVPADIVEISVKAENGDENICLGLNHGEVQEVFSIMQMAADEAAKEVGKVTSDAVLIALHAADSRSTVKKAAKNRAEALSAQEE